MSLLFRTQSRGCVQVLNWFLPFLDILWGSRIRLASKKFWPFHSQLGQAANTIMGNAVVAGAPGVGRASFFADIGNKI